MQKYNIFVYFNIHYLKFSTNLKLKRCSPASFPHSFFSFPHFIPTFDFLLHIFNCPIDYPFSKRPIRSFQYYSTSTCQYPDLLFPIRLIIPIFLSLLILSRIFRLEIPMVCASSFIETFLSF